VVKRTEGKERGGWKVMRMTDIICIIMLVSPLCSTSQDLRIDRFFPSPAKNIIIQKNRYLNCINHLKANKSFRTSEAVNKKIKNDSTWFLYVTCLIFDNYRLVF